MHPSLVTSIAWTGAPTTSSSRSSSWLLLALRGAIRAALMYARQSLVPDSVFCACRPLSYIRSGGGRAAGNRQAPHQEDVQKTMRRPKLCRRATARHAQKTRGYRTAEPQDSWRKPLRRSRWRPLWSTPHERGPHVCGMSLPPTSPQSSLASGNIAVCELHYCGLPLPSLVPAHGLPIKRDHATRVECRTEKDHLHHPAPSLAAVTM